MEKLKKTARRLDIICVVFMFVIIAATAIVLFADGESLKLELGSVSVNVPMSEMELWSRFLIKTLFYMPNAAIFFVCVIMVRRILSPMKEGRPFDSAVSCSLRRLGFLVLMGGAVSAVLAAVSQAFLVGQLDLGNVFSSADIREYGINYKIDGTFLIVAAVIFLLSYVFRYGEVLQQESDETL